MKDSKDSVEAAGICFTAIAAISLVAFVIHVLNYLWAT